MKANNLIVVIDDDIDEKEIFKLAISEISTPVAYLFFSSCEDVLKHFQQHGVEAPRLVLIDINLPAISGPECLIELQKLSEFDHPCIVIHSTSVPVKLKERLKVIGVDHFMEKSTSISVLAEKLEQLLRLSRS